MAIDPGKQPQPLPAQPPRPGPAAPLGAPHGTPKVGPPQGGPKAAPPGGAGAPHGPAPARPAAPQPQSLQRPGTQQPLHRAPASQPAPTREPAPALVSATKTAPSRDKVEVFRKKHRTSLLALLFSDMVGSTWLKQELGDAKAVALIQRHAEIVRQALGAFPEAQEISTAGDSFFCVFTRPSDAVACALKVQSAMRREFAQSAGPAGMPALPERPTGPGQKPPPAVASLSIRIGIHLGEVVVEERRDEAKPLDLFGLQVDTAARVMSLAEGGQILCTRAVFDNARQVLKGRDISALALAGPGPAATAQKLQPLAWLNHGPYVLKGVEEPIEVCEVGEKGIAPLRPPGISEKARPTGAAVEELGWRPAPDGKIPGTEWVLETKLGEGGFGEVWLGGHLRSKEKRVFKFCFLKERAKTLKRELALFRLIREQMGDTPGIVRLHEVFFEQPPYYLGIEYIPGRNLRDWLLEGKRLKKLPTRAKLEIVAQIAAGLDKAHRAGVIHQDIKPQNILVDEKLPLQAGGAPHVKLSDFGVGKVVDQEVLGKVGLTGGGKSLLRTTGSAGESGTILYMAPERIEGRGASTQSDLYSLGVVLFQMMARDMDRAVTLEWEREVRDPIVRIDLRKVLAGNPDRRLKSMGEFLERIRTWALRRRKRTRRRIAFFLLLVILACGGYVYFFQWDRILAFWRSLPVPW
ncbi:MAG: protein kinase [Planctomycetota bacterium]|nr:protein kinase [Planctomycetota bacterium]